MNLPSRAIRLTVLGVLVSPLAILGNLTLEEIIIIGEFSLLGVIGYRLLVNNEKEI